MKNAKYKVNYPDNSESTFSSCSSKNRVPQYLAAAAVTIGGFSLGNCLGYSSPALPSLKRSEDFAELEIHHLSWIASLVTIGAVVGSAFSGYAIANYGRKQTLVWLGAPFTLGWLMIFVARNLAQICVGRFLTGFSVGALSLVAPVYLSEISEPDIRGFLGAIFQVTVTLGILFTSIIGSLSSWRLLAGVCTVVPVIFIILSTFLPESPRYLLGMGRTNEAIEVLSRLRSNHTSNPSQRVLDEIDEMQAATSDDKQNCTLKDLITLPVLKPLLITFGLMLFNQFSGSNAVQFYTVFIFKETGLGLDAHVSSVIVGAVQVISTILASIFVDKAGRRILLQFSFAAMAISLLTLGTFFRMKSLPHNEILFETAHWIPLASVIVFNAAYCGGVGCLVWTVMSEILPSRTIGIASGLVTTFNWMLAFFTTGFFHSLNEALGIHNTFWLFSAACAVGLLFVFVCVPETKGISLDKIQEEHFQQEINLQKSRSDITSVASSNIDLV